ncbi:leucine-rich repeat-containing protein 36 isoform X2 [Ranitomeya imitator]|uniref:leucine-rich repeat-containing protein 36 isoform X2 n=1 Tax=Ranitomeya imitator TaxID=111125 RepID=UPI0037E89823
MAVRRVHLRESWVSGRAGQQAGTAGNGAATNGVLLGNSRRKSRLGFHGSLDIPFKAALSFFFPCTITSLTLEGTYRDKILTLGDAFKNFQSLRSLDLSRNLIVSLQGIEYLHALRSLNLYYNDIESLKEMERLRSLSQLKTLDLRLNPVTRQDASYRLTVIWTLGSLETLDERPVRDSERKNSKYNFQLKDYKTLDMSELEMGSCEKSPTYLQKTSAKAHLDFPLSSTDFDKIHDREKERQDYTKGISPAKYQTEEQQPSVRPQSDFDDEYRPLPSPPRSSLRSPGPSSRAKEGQRVTFAESTISELFPQKEDLDRQLESGDDFISRGKPTFVPLEKTESAFSFKNTYLTSTPVRREFASSDRTRVNADILNDIGQSTEYRDRHKSTEMSRDRLLRLSSDLYVTTHLTDPSTPSNSLSALRKGFTDVSKTYTLPSKPTLANTPLSTGKSLSRPEFRDYKNWWSLDRASGMKGDSLSVPQNGMKRASSLNSLLSPPVSSTDDLLSGNELRNRESPGSGESPAINEVLHHLMDLVDRYWNGSGSLLQNQRFLGPARDLLSSLSSTRHVSQGHPTGSPRQEDDGEATDSVNLKLIKVMEENHFLQSRVCKLENQATRKEGSGSSSLPQDDLRQKYERLTLQVESLQQQLEKTNKLQETVNLLHNSQRSLVCTNEYLLQQLNKISPNAVYKPRGPSPDRTSTERSRYSEATEPSAPLSHSAGHYRTLERLSLCPL